MVDLDGPLAQYFEEYEFDYDATEPATSEFYRMCDTFDWERDSEERNSAYQGFRIALTEQFNTKFGIDVNSLTSWQALCAALGLDPIPTELKTCKEFVTSTHVNLVDLVNEDTDGITVFGTVEELSAYTKETGKFFPSEDAHAGELLRYLLRHILDPSRDINRRGGAGGRRHRGRGRGYRGGITKRKRKTVKNRRAQ